LQHYELPHKVRALTNQVPSHRSGKFEIEKLDNIFFQIFIRLNIDFSRCIIQKVSADNLLLGIAFIAYLVV